MLSEKDRIGIVLVEDQAEDAELIRQAFSAQKDRYVLVTVHNLAEARAHIAQHPPDLVIADLLLQDGRGIELIPTDEDGYGYPVVIITSQGDERTAVEAIKAGTIEYVVKSVTTLSDMPRIVESALRQWNQLLEKRHIEAALIASEERYRTLVEDMPALVCRFLPDGTLTFVNEQYCNYFEMRPDELVGGNFFQFIPSEEQETVRQHYAALKPESPVVSYEHQVVGPDGTMRWQRWTDRALFDKQGTPIEYQSIGEDITPRKLMEQRLKAMALHDPLTDLPNRRLFNERLVHALVQAKRSKGIMAVFYLDMDYFKLVNDRFGHDIGDQVLRDTAKRLAGCVRASDTVARMGGDEFTILLESLKSYQDALVIAEKILGAFAEPFIINRTPIHLSASIGVSIYPCDGDQGEQLLSGADRAMYKAKQAGKNRYNFLTHPDESPNNEESQE